MRILQLNTQLSDHDDKLGAFLEQHDFDALALQEVSQRTLRRFSALFDGHFERSFYQTGEEFGIALLVRKGLQMTNIKFLPYTEGDGWTTNTVTGTEGYDYYSRGRFGILKGDIDNGKGEKFRIGTTYFPVSYPAHETNDDQRHAMANLLQILEEEDSMALTGDFNIARSNNRNDMIHPLYSSLSFLMRDNVPTNINNTLDPKLYKVPGLEVVCDYIWSRGKVGARNVQLHSGLSDHQGISADVHTIN